MLRQLVLRGCLSCSPGGARPGHGTKMPPADPWRGPPLSPSTLCLFFFLFFSPGMEWVVGAFPPLAGTFTLVETVTAAPPLSPATVANQERADTCDWLLHPADTSGKSSPSISLVFRLFGSPFTLQAVLLPCSCTALPWAEPRSYFQVQRGT